MEITLINCENGNYILTTDVSEYDDVKQIDRNVYDLGDQAHITSLLRDIVGQFYNKFANDNNKEDYSLNLFAMIGGGHKEEGKKYEGDIYTIYEEQLEDENLPNKLDL